mmetsp:Transcript_8775/g.19460  ORF Transcript_8775/g.19460 Transcript_8775/m.19460 type:complete len:339 (+) Transcript_8775:249-1265(+)
MDPCRYVWALASPAGKYQPHMHHMHHALLRTRASEANAVGLHGLRSFLAHGHAIRPPGEVQCAERLAPRLSHAAIDRERLGSRPVIAQLQLLYDRLAASEDGFKCVHPERAIRPEERCRRRELLVQPLLGNRWQSELERRGAHLAVVLLQPRLVRALHVQTEGHVLLGVRAARALRLAPPQRGGAHLAPEAHEADGPQQPHRRAVVLQPRALHLHALRHLRAQQPLQRLLAAPRGALLELLQVAPHVAQEDGEGPQLLEAVAQPAACRDELTHVHVAEAVGARLEQQGGLEHMPPPRRRGGLSYHRRLQRVLRRTRPLPHLVQHKAARPRGELSAALV